MWGAVALAGVVVIGPSSAWESSADLELTGASVAQESDSRAPDAAAIAKLLDAVQNGRAVVKPQAAARLATLGAPAADAIVERLDGSVGALAEIGPELTEVLCNFGDPRLRQLAWSAALTADFPWKPAAVRSLSGAPEDGEGERFLGLLDSPVAFVRAAAADALGRLGLELATPALKQRLGDESGAVRRAAALALDAFGQGQALVVLWAELQRNDSWGELATGRTARMEAVRALRERLDAELFGYDASSDPASPENQRALTLLAEHLAERAGGKLPGLDSLPSAAQPSAWNTPAGASVLRLELMSCVAGSVDLLLDDSNVLWVGRGNPASVELPEDSSAVLLEIFRQATSADAEVDLDDDSRRWVFGRRGCDTESYAIRADDAAPLRALVTRDWDDRSEPRPDSFDALMRSLLPLLPDATSDDPRLDHLRTRVRRVATSIGGPLEPAPR